MSGRIDVEFPGHDGVTLRGWLYAPDGGSGRPGPAVERSLPPAPVAVPPEEEQPARSISAAAGRSAARAGFGIAGLRIARGR